MPALTGILETAIYVDHLAVASAFYRDIMGLLTLLADERMCAFDVSRRSVLLVFARGASLNGAGVPGGFIPPHDGAGKTHLAFAIAAAELPAWEAHLLHCKVPIESRVYPPLGGTSIYFRDPDGNLIELATPGIWPIY